MSRIFLTKESKSMVITLHGTRELAALANKQNPMIRNY